MVKTLMSTLQILFCGLLVVQLTGCGTLLYPERRGQRGGHVDVGVALLDGIGLFFFIIPGRDRICGGFQQRDDLYARNSAKFSRP